MPSLPENCPAAQAGPPGQRDTIAVEVSDTQSFLIVDPCRLTRLASDVIRGEGILSASISIAIVDDPTIHRINREHLRHDWPTDVISFVLSDPGEACLSGELIISAETACSSAAELGAEAADELDLYVVHGLLHLCGYDDTSEGPAEQMRERQRVILEGRAVARAGREFAS